MTADDATAYADTVGRRRSMPSQERLVLAEGEEHYDEEMVL
jgi:hypothetical protein